VTHFFLPSAYVVGGLAAVAAAVGPRLMSRRSLNDYQVGHPLLAAIERFLHKRMAIVCGNSRAVVSQLAGEGVDSDRLRLIYNGVDPEPPHAGCRARIRRELGIGDSDFVLAIVANLIPYKGHADLLDALSQIAARLELPWALLVVGRDDGIGSALRCMAQKGGIADHVRWLGSRTDVPAILEASDAGVLASHQEGFSNALIEAMAAGLPMVVTDVGGNAEAVLDGETGYVVPPRDAGRLAEAILRLAVDPNRRRLGDAGKKRAEGLFSLSECVSGYEKIYRELAETKGG
jgi:glycosyltransferase involved in cell wall biosynthesis